MANLKFVFVPLAATLLLAFALSKGKLSLVIILIHVRSQEQEQNAAIATLTEYSLTTKAQVNGRTPHSASLITRFQRCCCKKGANISQQAAL